MACVERSSSVYDTASRSIDLQRNPYVCLPLPHRAHQNGRIKLDFLIDERVSRD